MEKNEKKVEIKENEAEQARKVLEALAEKARQECWKEISEVLEKHKFQLTASTIINSSGRIMHQFELVPWQGRQQ
jgi:hypothetical protein